jgi:hypothetical protein
MNTGVRSQKQWPERNDPREHLPTLVRRLIDPAPTHTGQAAMRKMVAMQ